MPRRRCRPRTAFVGVGAGNLTSAVVTAAVVGGMILAAVRRGRTPTSRTSPPRFPRTGLVLLALRLGDLSVVSALTALYPGGTILLAAFALGERIAAAQWIGLVLALTAGAMLAVG